ncbi:MAG: Txe/YoeB family addiction module toxin [Desulfobacteraceae bacterium]|nr:Txe/YoeB family addiction module toxin [Desulfobacteraceae bacterium]MCP4345562.1 Txe/YoeB family addiction module toxin [Desulfobacterales bacterium]
MMIAWTDRAWDEYLYWQKYDKKIIKRINELIRDIKRHPEEGIGRPEALRFELSGKWSRRITQEHRLVYQMIDEMIVIFQCRYHY